MRPECQPVEGVDKAVQTAAVAVVVVVAAAAAAALQTGLAAAAVGTRPHIRSVSHPTQTSLHNTTKGI